MSAVDAKNEQWSEHNFKNDRVLCTYWAYPEYMKCNCYQVFYDERQIKSYNEQRFHSSILCFSVVILHSLVK